MELYVAATMKDKSDKEKYSMVLLAIGQGGRDIFSTWTWIKKRNQDGEETTEDDITVEKILEKFEAHCIPKKNVIYERMKFFQRNQRVDEPLENFLTSLRE